MNFFTFVYLAMFFFGIYFITIFIILQIRNNRLLNKNPSITKHYSISFLVPAYNEEGSLESTVKAILGIDYPPSKKEIIIINDGSSDKTLQIAKKLELKYPLLRVLNKANSGKADSLNKGIQIAKGELIGVVDADSYPNADSLKKMIGYFDDERVAAVTSRVLVKNKVNWLSNFQVLDYSIIAWTRKLLDFVDSVYVTNGPLSVYRKDIVKSVGGFDRKNLTEDIEITWNILSKGYKTKMAYDAIVYTTVPISLKVWVNQRVRWNLGGLQTVQKYWRYMFTKGAFGNFVLPYVSGSFVLAILGFLLLVRYFWVKGSYYIISVYYSIFGYNYLKYFDFSIYFTLLLYFGAIFFILAIVYYRIGFRNSETGNQSIIKILTYSFVYRSLYILPLLIALYKLGRNDIRWYTK